LDNPFTTVDVDSDLENTLAVLASCTEMLKHKESLDRKTLKAAAANLKMAAMNVEGIAKYLPKENTEDIQVIGSEEENMVEASELNQPVLRHIHFLKSSGSVAFCSIIGGAIYAHFRLKWPWSYSCYWTVVTALTVGYGDAPTCDINSSTLDSDATIAFGSVDGGSGNAQESTGALVDLSTVDNPCGYRSIRDSNGDMIFVMFYSTLMVTVALSMLTEFLEALEIQQRKRESKAQRIMLEAYFEGQALDNEAIARAVELSAKDEDELESKEASFSDDSADVPSACGRFLGYFNNYPIVKAMAVHAVIMIIGVLWYGYYYNEHWIDSTYWVVITGLAVGFGDIHPTDNVGYWVGFFYITVVVFSNLQLLMKFVSAFRSQKKVHDVLSMTFDMSVMNAFNRNHDGFISRDEYLAGVLVMMDKVDFDTIDLVNRHFDVMDLDGGGEITAAELEKATQKHRRNSTMQTDLFKDAKMHSASRAASMRNLPAAGSGSLLY